MKSKLIEIKARCPNIDDTRKTLNRNKADYDGTFHQVDTYFNTTSGRLKMREVEGEGSAKLIYYDREDIPDPKQSDVLIVETLEPDALKETLKRSIGVKVTVAKRREIYQFQGTQVHLDKVEGLGTYVEFERPITELSEDRIVLEALMKELGIAYGDLITVSYSDLLLTKSAA